LLLRKYLFVIITLIAFTFFSCKESPRNFNSNLLGPDQINLVNLDSYNAGLLQKSSSFKTVIETGSSSTLILGNYTTHSGNLQEASILIQFNYSSIPDSDKSDLINGDATVIDSWMIFTKTYAFGDTTVSQIDFGAYKINTPWTPAGFTSDSLTNFSYNSDDLSLQKSLTDSTNIYRVHVNSAAIQNQISNYANSIQDNGIYLKPNAPGGTVWGFGSLSSSSFPAIAVVVNKTGSYTDTLYFNALSDLSVLSGDLPSTQGEIYLQSSLVGQSKIWFDVSNIPAGAIINQAKLILKTDLSNTVNGTVFNPSVLTFNIADSISNRVDSSLSPETITQADSSTYEGDITTFVQKWVFEKNNRGLLLTPQSGLSGMEIFAFKGSDASNLSQRPRLVIVYTKK